MQSTFVARVIFSGLKRLALAAVLLGGLVHSGCGAEECAAGKACIFRGGTVNTTCGGSGGGCAFECYEGADCNLSCPGGNCSLKCSGAKSCAISCPGNSCAVSCATTGTCKVTGCTSNCGLQCGGAATCQSSCALSGGCATTP